MGVRNLQIGTVMNAVAWAKAALMTAIRTPAGSPERMAKLAELTTATEKARHLADAYQGKLAVELRIGLKVAELGLRYLQDPNRSRGRHVRNSAGEFE